jgi:putative transposase
VYRTRQPRVEKPAVARPPAARALSVAEKTVVRDTLNSDRFADQAPREVYATLLDEQRYLCSVASMYRILRENREIRERRNQLRHPAYAKPELLATGPKQVWSWDITKLLGPVKWTYFFLYVLLDIFSRYIVGWLIAERESSDLAQVLMAATCQREHIAPHQLTIHADNGGPMTAKPLALLLADLGVGNSHSRPHVSNDNPFSEAHFKTLKYHPTFPERFGSHTEACRWFRPFVQWYNWEHHHTGLGLLTPGVVHTGQAPHVLAQRQQVLQQAYLTHPERFVLGRPHPPALPTAVWINPPKPEAPYPVGPPAPPGVDTDVRH